MYVTKICMKNTILDISKTVGKALKRQTLTISAAESCTGGAVLSSLTDIPGSSHYVQGGVVAYSNQVKIEQLNVSKDILTQFGAVSKSVALQMAKQAAKLMNADIGISTTGIAGPGGGSKEKPVGTVWLGFWSADVHFAIKPNFSGKRLQIKQQTVKLALKTVHHIVLNIEPLADNFKLYFADE